MTDKSILTLGLLGQNIQYSLSPKIHLSSAEKLGLQATYSLVDIPAPQVKEFIENFWAVGGTGFNVTTPYKELVAEIIGTELTSVNTVYRGDKGWEGTSTDGEGFINSLKHMSLKLEDINEMTFLGSGGAVLGILQYIASTFYENTTRENPLRINILRRNPSRDDLICAIHHPLLQYQFYDFKVECLKDIVQENPNHLLVHATSAPAHGQDLTEFTTAMENFKGSFYDLGYAKPPSTLLQYCLKHHIVCLNGLAMLVEQAMLSQEFWFGDSAYPNMELLS